MPRDEVDSSLIVDGPCKRKLAPYATNEDNCSADMNETVKRMKKNAGLTESQTSVEQFDDGDEGTHPRHDTSSLGSRNPPGGTRDGSKSQSRSHRGAKASGNRTRGSAKGSARHTESDDGIHDPEDPASPSNPDSGSPHDPEDEEIVEVIEEDPEHKLGKLVQYLS